jgi:predicted ester cyclase
VTDVETNKQITRRWFEQMAGKGSWDSIRELFSPSYVHHAPHVENADLAAYEKTAGVMLGAFPDMVAMLHELVAEGEYVALRYSVRGTHTGDFHGIAPTGRTVAFDVIGMQRIVGGRIVEGWFEFDSAAIYAQLGVRGLP